MSQADSSNITGASRRLFIAGGTAASVFGALAVAAKALPIAQDPVFAALDAFAQADAAWKVAQDHEDALVASDPEMSRRPRVKIGMWTDLVRESPYYNQERPFYLYDEEAILRHTAGPSSRNGDRFLAEFREDAARQERLQRVSGLTEAERICEEAWEKRCECETAAFETVPTTLDGAVALAQFSEQRFADGVVDDDAVAFNQTILAFLIQLRASA